MNAKRELIKRIEELTIELYKLKLEHESGYALRRKLDMQEEQHKTAIARLKSDIALKEEIISDQAKAIKELKGEV